MECQKHLILPCAKICYEDLTVKLIFITINQHRREIKTMSGSPIYSTGWSFVVRMSSFQKSRYSVLPLKMSSLQQPDT